MPWRGSPEARAQEVVARVLALAPTEEDEDLVARVASDCDAKAALVRFAAFFAQEAS